MNGDAERRRLFDAFSRQWDLGGGTPPGIFVCPLCRDGYTREALDGPAPSVSLAHVVPQALGGRLCTLTCTPCNNGNGTRVEAALCEKLRYDAWAAGVGTWPARVSAQHAGADIFRDMGMEFRRSADTSDWKLYLVRKQSHPAHADEFCDGADRSGGTLPDGARLILRWSAPRRPAEVAAAIYQSAYLVMFSYFGYAFATNDRYEPLRQQILRPEENVWPGHINLLGAGDGDGLLAGQHAGVLFVREPEPCVAVLLRFRPRGGRGQVFGVLLPAPDAAGDAVPAHSRGELRGSLVPYLPETIPSDLWHFGRLWQQVVVRP